MPRALRTMAQRALSEDDYELLNWLIFQIQPGMIVKVVYFDNGEYIQKRWKSS